MRRLAVTLALVAVAATVAPAAGQEGPRRVPLAEFDPLPAAGDVEPSAETLALRDELLGDHWDDPAYVTLHWTGVSSFVVTIGGHLLLFDAWEIIGAVDDYLPLGRDELAALDPEAVLVGHGHFDHAGDLGLVAGRSGAVVVGSEEICTVAASGAVREGAGTDFTCAITGTATTPPPGTAQSLQLFADLPRVTVLQHVHSAATPPGGGNEPDPFLPVMDLDPYLEHLADDPAELVRFVEQQQEQDQGGTWLYHLADGDFTLVLGDSAGPIFDHPEVTEALGAFPGCVDVLANAILGFDQPVSGLQDPALYVAAMRPKVFVPTHADAWAPVISAGQAQYAETLDQALAEEGVDPEVDLLLDPQDYLAERAYRVADPRWRAPVEGTRCAAATGGPTPDPAPTSPTVAPTADDGAGAGPDLPATGGGAAVVAVVLLLAALSPRRARRRARAGRSGRRAW